ncbi:hypothetical protein B0J11DRAFT_542889 [Dendryphion nanum]|uniref:ATP adenylyltransferase n=1 Tax=Dendryphion nanum TaxID=256645 RepID=A0A9P9D491_9PLEO|nr:hypothetical protein B0J11DRAFT_542889 [Dendryphion nanum]
MDELSEDNLIRVFDELVEEGVIVYEPHQVIERDFGGYQVEFRICPSLTKKPHKVGAKLDPAFNKTEKWGPGSDMYSIDDRLEVARPNNNTHVLTLNLFCVDRPQLVMLTQDSYRRQHEPLDIDDFKAVLEIAVPLQNMYFIYNCSEAAGCSRVHKHLQGLRGPPRAFQQLLQADKSKDKIAVPFQYFIHHFEHRFEDIAASDMLAKYESLFEQARNALGLEKGVVCPHNVVLWKGWMIVIPRRKGAHGKASANAAGMLGSFWVPDRSLLDAYAVLNPREVLEELGVPW